MTVSYRLGAARCLPSGPTALAQFPAMFEQTFKNIDDILHKDAACTRKKSTFSEEQIAYALRQVDPGTALADVCRQLGISDATFYVWKKRFARLGVREVRSLEQENRRLKQVVADLTIDTHMLSEALRKNA